MPFSDIEAFDRFCNKCEHIIMRMLKREGRSSTKQIHYLRLLIY